MNKLKTLERLPEMNRNLRKRIMPLIAIQVHKLRLQNKLTQADMAKYLHVSTQQYQKYERGKDQISSTTLLCIAVLFDHPIELFYEAARQYLEE